MPLFCHNGKTYYFAHVPKCGGSAVEGYLRKRFGPLAFCDPGFLDQPEADRWSRTSPQHVDAATLARLFPPGFFAATFAVVRHPVARMRSEYQYDLALRGIPAPDLPFAVWLEQSLNLVTGAPFLRDNHLRPQIAFVPQDGCRLFRLEEGLEAIIPWLDEQTHSRAGPRKIPVAGPRGARGHVDVSPADIDRIAEHFRVDFEAFGYDPHDPAALLPMRTVRSGLDSRRMSGLRRMLGRWRDPELFGLSRNRS